MLDRRGFLFGSAAVLAAATLPAPLQAIEQSQVFRATLDPRLGARRVCDIMFSAMPSQGGGMAMDPMAVTFFRNDTPLLNYGIHPLATVRWVARADAEFVMRENDAFSITVEHPQPEVNVTIVSTVGTHYLGGNRQRDICFTECYRWHDRQLVMQSCEAVDLSDKDQFA